MFEPIIYVRKTSKRDLWGIPYVLRMLHDRRKKIWSKSWSTWEASQGKGGIYSMPIDTAWGTKSTSNIMRKVFPYKILILIHAVSNNEVYSDSWCKRSEYIEKTDIMDLCEVRCNRREFSISVLVMLTIGIKIDLKRNVSLNSASFL